VTRSERWPAQASELAVRPEPLQSMALRWNRLRNLGLEDNKPLDGDDHAKHAHSARTADMQGTLQSVPALTATFSALVLFTGIVYNIGYFFPFNLQLLSLLTVSEFLFSPIVATYFMIILTIVVWTMLFSFIMFLRSLLAKVWLHIFLSLFMVRVGHGVRN
jgi:hypothetical protein